METIRSVSAISLESCIVTHDSGHREDRISKQIVVTGGQVIAVCRMILFYEARATNSLFIGGFRGGGQGGHAPPPQDAKSRPLPCLAYAVLCTEKLNS